MTVILANNIDLAGIEWNPDGSFGGIFDGNGKTISNLTVTGISSVGFFKKLSTTAVVRT